MRKKSKPVKIIFITFKSGVKCKEGNINSQFFFDTWAGIIARRFHNRNPGFDVEVWRVESGLKKVQSIIENDIKAFLFPYRFPLIKKILTLEMYLLVKKYERKFRLIIHYFNLFDLFGMVGPGILNNSQIILSHHGGLPPNTDKLKGLLKSYMIKLSYKKLFAITYLRREIKDYLSMLPDHPPLFFLPVGADFDEFTPIDKNYCRKKLALEPAIIYGIYVGPYSRIKNVELIIDAYNSLKCKYNFKIIFVGGKNDHKNELYHEVKKTGCPVFGFINWSDMKYYFNAADFYIQTVFNFTRVGFDVSIIEALACNIPVVSTQLQELDFDYSELGINIDKKEEVISKIEQMIMNYKKMPNCREVAKKQLDGKTVIIDKLAKIYGI